MLSQEGGDNAEVTNAAMAMLQGDNAAMTMYATSTWPLGTSTTETADDNIKQVWFTVVALQLDHFKGSEWWDYLKAKRPDVGYCPKPTKTILTMKNKTLRKAATKMFNNTGIKIADQGEATLEQ